MRRARFLVFIGFLALLPAAHALVARPAPGASRMVSSDGTVPVTVLNFTRAETDRYFGNAVNQTGLGRFEHGREFTPVDEQSVVRMNRDTLYSWSVFDLEAAPVTITLPDSGERYMSLMVLNQDHYAIDVAYAPATVTLTREKVGTRYVQAILRTLADPNDPADLKEANALQDAVRVEQASVGVFEVPSWDPVSLTKVRDALAVLGSTIGTGTGAMFGKRDEVDPVLHLIGTAVGWGGNPPSAAVYRSGVPERNDGKTPYVLTVGEVPVDGFWSITVYGESGFMVENELDRYSLNNLTAERDADGSTTIRFGGDPSARNHLPISPGWNYTVRLYRPRAEILDGSWSFPEAQPAR